MKETLNRETVPYSQSDRQAAQAILDKITAKGLDHVTVRDLAEIIAARAVQAEPASQDATETMIRMFLWQGHGHEGIYGDDGEMQCGECGCDYKRDSLDKIVEKARVAALESGLKRLRGAEPAGKLTASCPICGKWPLDLACVRDWLLAADMPLHSEWQERMIQYANEVVRALNARPAGAGQGEALLENADLLEICQKWVPSKALRLIGLQTISQICNAINDKIVAARAADSGEVRRLRGYDLAGCADRAKLVEAMRKVQP